MMSVKFHHDLK